MKRRPALVGGCRSRRATPHPRDVAASLHFGSPNIEDKVPRAGMLRRFRASRQLNLVVVVQVRLCEIYVIAGAQVSAPSTVPYGGN